MYYLQEPQTENYSNVHKSQSGWVNCGNFHTWGNENELMIAVCNNGWNLQIECDRSCLPQVWNHRKEIYDVRSSDRGSLWGC